MTTNKLINQYAKAYNQAKQAQDILKELKPVIYDHITEHGEQTIGRKTYTIENGNYIIRQTESNPAERVDYKALVMSLLNMTTEKEIKEYAKKHGFTKTQNGAITILVITKEN